MNSIDYNAVSDQLTILNGKQQILCRRKNPKVDLLKEFGVNEEDVQHIRALLHQTSAQNKEISVQIKATVENDSQMYKLKLHTLWSPIKKDGYVGIVGYFGVVKQKNAKETQKESPNEKGKTEQSFIGASGDGDTIFLLSGCGGKRTEKEDAETITAYLWSTNLYEKYAPYIHEQFIRDTELSRDDLNRNYDDIVEMFQSGRLAMYFGSSAGVKMFQDQGINTTFLPFFQENGKKWIMTTPYFRVALNRDLTQDETRRKKAMEVLSTMLSENAQNRIIVIRRV